MSCLALRISQQAPCCIYHPWLLPMLPSNSKNTHYTLKRCGLCLCTNFLLRYDNGEEWRRGYNDFSLRMSMKVSLINPSGRMFRDCLAGRPYPRDTYKNDNLARLFSFQSCAPHVALSQLSFSQASCEIH